MTLVSGMFKISSVLVVGWLTGVLASYSDGSLLGFVVVLIGIYVIGTIVDL